MAKTNVMINTCRKLCGYKFPRLGRRLFELFFKMAPQNITCELFPNIIVKLNLKDLTMKATFWQGDRFEFPTAAVLKGWGGEKFFDIGANYGFYSLFMLHKINKIMVYAFEPNPSTYERLKIIRQNNNLERLQLFHCGLGSQSGQFDLHPGINDSGHSTFLQHPEFVNNSIGKVNILTFNQWIDVQEIKLPNHPEWIAKIDVEGMEFDVLLGMQKALEARAFKGIIVEILEHTLNLADHTPEDIYNFMQNVGYQPLNNKKLTLRYGRINTANVFFEPMLGS